MEWLRFAVAARQLVTRCRAEQPFEYRWRCCKEKRDSVFPFPSSYAACTGRLSYFVNIGAKHEMIIIPFLILILTISSNASR
jgi:hypothetical protein